MIGGQLRLTEIATPRLRMRALEIDDAEDLRQLTNDPAILSAIHFLPEPFTLEDAHALIRRNTAGCELFLGGRRIEDDRLALVFGVHQDEQGALEIGYWVGVAFQGAGLAQDAAAAVIARLQTLEPQRHIFAECRQANVASWHLLAKLGFRANGEPGRRPGRLRLSL